MITDNLNESELAELRAMTKNLERRDLPKSVFEKYLAEYAIGSLEPVHRTKVLLFLNDHFAKLN